jgi:hypothetical protein
MTFRAPGIPLWVTVVIAAFAIFSTTFGVVALINPKLALGYVDGADAIALGWAGRNAGIGLAMAAAFFLRNASAYAVTFLAGIMRELGDGLSMLSGDVGTGGVVVLVVILAIEVSCLTLSLRAARQTSPAGA